jgi:hypothetical protein
VLHAKQAAGNAKIEAFRAWIVSIAQRSRLDVSGRELRKGKPMSAHRPTAPLKSAE